MKIFFNSSFRGRNEYLPNYQAIHSALLKTGHRVNAAPVMEENTGEIIKGNSVQIGNYYQQIVKWIKQADVCVFEVSYPSTSIGHEIAVAIAQSKPVIALHVKSAPENLVLESMKDDRLQLMDYSMDNVETLVHDAIEYALEQSDTRFNFFISPQIGSYLDKISKEKRVPRAVYLRRLIEDDMENNTEFNR